MPHSNPTPSTLPDPGSVALLGSVLELRVREPSGRVVQHTWKEHEAPGLLWSPEQRAVLFFPQMLFRQWVDIRKGSGPLLREQRLDMREARQILSRRGVKLSGDFLRAAKLYTAWAARPPTKLTQKQIDPLKLHCNGAGVHIVYRSDKWNGENGKRVDYIHHFAKSGTVKVSSTNGGTATKPPKCFFIRGGRLTVTERGIIY